MKQKKSIKKILLGIAVLLVLFLVLLSQSTFSFTANRFSAGDYRNIMAESILGNPALVDVAMLGAHDALSGNIRRNNPGDTDPADGAVTNNPLVRALGGGLITRLVRAQKSGAYELAVHGVRYFDIRVSWVGDDSIGGVWYTKHGYLSAPLEESILGLLRFLAEAGREVLVLDVQHAYTGEKTMEELLSFLFTGVSYGGRTLADYAGYDTRRPLGELRYRDMTASGSQIVVLAKAPFYPGSLHYQYEGAIRSVWHNQNTDKAMLAGIEEEYRTLLASPSLDRDKFRVNQAQKTGITGNMLGSLFSWSLLDMAARFNRVLVNHDDFSVWLTTMPIFMVDYADSMRGGFNDRVIAEINRFNGNL
ncbi:MAG: hypothetical protein LBT11_06125 [Treponema sp.]|jgi:hypothetical protein|nr:hypothetical protein [Treponema sp.]